MRKLIALSLSDAVFIMLMNVKMPTIVGILTYMSRINFNAQLSWALKKFYNLRARDISRSKAKKSRLFFEQESTKVPRREKNVFEWLLSGNAKFGLLSNREKLEYCICVCSKYRHWTFHRENSKESERTAHVHVEYPFIKLCRYLGGFTLQKHQKGIKWFCPLYSKFAICIVMQYHKNNLRTLSFTFYANINCEVLFGYLIIMQ